MPVLIKRGSLSGGGRSESIESALRALLQYQAARVVQQNAHTAITDNSTGTAGSAGTPAIPSAAFNGVAGTNAAQGSGFNTALGTVHNACAVLMDSIDDLADLLGIPGARAEGNGTIAVADTVAAITKTVTGVNANGVAFATGVAAMRVVRGNVATIIDAVNKVARATGVSVMAQIDATPDTVNNSIVDYSAPGVNADATTSISKAVADAFLTACADTLAAVAAKYNTIRGLTPLTRTPVVLAG